MVTKKEIALSIIGGLAVTGSVYLANHTWLWVKNNWPEVVGN